MRESGDQVVACQQKITGDSDVVRQADFIVSYGYKHILKADVLEKFQRRVVNIHISLLPWNRGADPNLWSFLENTPKGVSIHYIDLGIDTGDILVQREVHFSLEETLRTTYEKLSGDAEDLFQENWLDIRNQQIESSAQSMIGSFHLRKDRLRYEHLLVDGWDTPVSKIVGKALIYES